jgi:hypothetical protein
MPIDPLREHVLSLSALARRVPPLRQGRPINPSTIYRWITGGARGVKLESCFVGGVRCSSVEALGRFLAAVNAAGQPVPAESATADQDAVEAALNARAFEPALRQPPAGGAEAVRRHPTPGRRIGSIRRGGRPAGRGRR